MAVMPRVLPRSGAGPDLLAAAIEICPQPLAIAREGAVLWSNAAFASLFGYATPAELEQLELANLFPPGHSCNWTAQADALAEPFGCGFPGCDFLGFKKNGARVSVESSCRWFSRGGKPLLMMAARDISKAERRRVPREGAARFRAIFEASAIGIAHCTLTCRLAQTNSALPQMLGYSPEELNGRHFGSISHPDASAAAAAHCHGQIECGSREQEQLRPSIVRNSAQSAACSLSSARTRSPSGERLC